MEFQIVDVLYNQINHIISSDNVLMTLLMVPPLLVAERLFSAHKVSWSHYRFGLLFFAVNAALLGALAPTINFLTATGVQALGYGLFDLSAWGFEGVSGSFVALFASTVMLDFFFYWFHRALHHYPILWQMHLLHHSDENMNMLTAQRGHFFEGLMAPFFITLPMAFLFKIPAIDIAILSLLPLIYQFIAHANIRLGYGRLWWVILSPDYHRIHHSIEAKHRDKNFTNWFPVWDIIFGTLHRPGVNERPITGVTNIEVNSLWDAYALPLKGWHSMIRTRAFLLLDSKHKQSGL